MDPICFVLPIFVLSGPPLFIGVGSCVYYIYVHVIECLMDVISLIHHAPLYLNSTNSPYYMYVYFKKH